MTESVNVLLLSGISEEYRQRIAGVSPRVKLTDISELVAAESRGDDAASKKLDALLAGAEVLYGFRLPRNLLARAPGLRWVQVMSAGVDRYLGTEIMDSPVILTNVSGIHAGPIGEFVLGIMLMFVKQMPFCFQLQQQRKWQRVMSSVLHSKTVGIIGLGNIGREVARLSKAFGMRVVATRRRAKTTGRARYVDAVYPPEQLPQLLGESDFVVLALPFTPETSKIIGEAELRAMKPTAYLINIARGGVVDEEALVRALEEKRIAGAGLDVFATEPLPPESRLWQLPNVIISPHTSGVMDNYVEQSTDLFIENLKRYLAGKKMLTVVNKKLGY